jgi:hypothetical protein
MLLMLDWYSGLTGYSAVKLKPDTLKRVTPSGEEKWSKELNIQSIGSFDDTAIIGPAAPTKDMLEASQKYNLLVNPVCLYISVNPTKYLQGHNVGGPSVEALGPMVTETIRHLPEKDRPEDSESELLPALHRTRVDIAVMIDMGSEALVHEWLRVAERSSRSRHGRALVSGDTVYWGQHSRRWTFKAYGKMHDLKDHPPKVSPEKMQALQEFSQGKLRLELCLRTPELEGKGTLTEELVWQYMNKIEFGVMKEVRDMSKIEELPRSVQMTFMLWKAGTDVRFKLPKATFYRHRQLIKKVIGEQFDIALPVPDDFDKKAKIVNFDIAWLKEHEIKVPAELMTANLFDPARLKMWPVH